MTGSLPSSDAALPDLPASVDWQIGVFCQNEANRLPACLRSIDAAVGGRPALITVFLNGSTDNSLAVARATLPTLATPATVFVFPAADKANAINHYLHDPKIRVEANLYFAVDGYATVNPGGLAATEATLRARPDALIASGVAGNGRDEPKSTARTVAEGGIMHGQFYCMPAALVHRMAQAGIRLPVGLYRGDGLLGSIAAHDLDPVHGAWLNSRVVGVAGAMFLIDPLSPFRLRDWRRQFNRKVRQMRGLIENAAIRATAHAHGFAALPASADHMIRDHLRTHAVPTVPLLDRPFMQLALRQHRRAVPPEPASLEPWRVA